MDSPTASEGGIDRLRRKLGEIDHQLLDLLNRRMEVARRIGEWKRRNDLFIFDPGREEAVIADLIRKSAGSLSHRAIRAIFLEIFSSARAQQGDLRIGYGGGVSGLLAAQSRFGASDHYRRVRCATAGWDLLKAHSIDILVLPKEALLDLAPSVGEKFGSRQDWCVCGEVDPLQAPVHRRSVRRGFYLVQLEGEMFAPPELPGVRKEVFLMAGCSRESLARWPDRLGASWNLAGWRAGTEGSRADGSLVTLWEALSAPPVETLQEACREVCGDSAWIVRLGAYPIPSVTRL